MSEPSGWYDDPEDPTLLRYWDGVVWTDHTAPRISPTLEQSRIAEPPAVSPASQARPQWRDQAAYPPSAPAGPGASPAGSPQQQAPQQQAPQPYAAPGAAEGAPPAYPGYAPAPAWTGATLGAPTTPDGVALSGWWKRVLATILDNIITFVLALPLTAYFYGRAFSVLRTWVESVMTDARAGSTTPPTLPAEFYAYILPAGLLALLVYVAYEVFFLTRTGATWGKRALGISVRLRERPGPLTLSAAARRVAVKEVGSLVGVIPGIGLIGSLFSTVDSLWPLWDPHRQAIHDKAAATNVVVGRQPPRST